MSGSIRRKEKVDAPTSTAADNLRQNCRQAMLCGVAALLLLMLCGCKGNNAEPVRLTLISPHRDEIRQEFDWGFQDWFRERTETRAAAARMALQQWLLQPSPAALSAARRSFSDLFYDWHKGALA